MRRIYADNAATTRMSDNAVKAMMPFLQDNFYNASSLYGAGQGAKEALTAAREQIAKLIGAETNEIYFTSGGSEADNQAILSAAAAGARKGKKHIVSTAFEHHAVLHTLKKLGKEGFEIELLPVGTQGNITAEQVKNAIREDTCLVTTMYANNEIGSILPIAEIGAVCREKGVTFHTDAVQATGHLPIDVKKENIDMLSMSAHKFHGPKGIGALYCRRGVFLQPLIEGGAQERGKRAGTENVGAACGAGKDSARRAERHERKPSARKRELLFRGGRGRKSVAFAGRQGRLRFFRFGMHFGFSGPVARAACHRAAA